MYGSGALANILTSPTIGASKSSLTHENIGIQFGDAAIQSAETIYSEIIKAVKLYRPVNARAAFKNTEIASLYARLDGVLSTRFGITINHIPAISENSDYSAYIAYGSFPHVYVKDALENLDKIEDYFLTYIKEVERDPETGQITNMDQLRVDDHYAKIFQGIQTNAKQISAALHANNVIIDVKHAVMHNIPNGVILRLAIDPIGMFIVDEQDAKEATAAMLHEIGHQFMYLHNVYLTHSSLTKFSDSIRENMLGKNMPSKLAIRTAYAHTYGGEYQGSRNDNEQTIILSVITKHMMSTFRHSNSNIASADEEDYADSFAVRFGYGSDLARSLQRGHRGDDYTVASRMAMNDFAIITIAFVIGIVLMLPLAIGIIGLYTIIIAIVFSSSDYDNTVTTHGNSLGVRLAKIRSEMTHLLNNDNFPKENVMAHIKAIDEVTARLDQIGPEKIGVILKLARMVNSANKKYDSIRDISVYASLLLGNPLIAATHRLKQIGASK